MGVDLDLGGPLAGQQFGDSFGDVAEERTGAEGHGGAVMAGQEQQLRCGGPYIGAGRAVVAVGPLGESGLVQGGVRPLVLRAVGEGDQAGGAAVGERDLGGRR
ncbi:hypothetical protein ACFYXF_03955 [Streptomyces sp. NPDC002680]|uniref:hypothetical protein n=1 Tax=Streptomyces sp. NPDC002680 TaxID=3364659 RepID=UPI0036746128